MRDVIIIGGGLAGLVTAINLSRTGLKVSLIEKKQYPFHKVCGEYISNEAYPYFEWLGVNFKELNPSSINNLLLSSPSGKFLKTKLDLGGFGVSRYRLDDYLARLSVNVGVELLTGYTVENVTHHENHFQIRTNDNKELDCKIVIGAYGKRSKLDKTLNRAFMEKRSPYLGVKYHISTDFPKDLIALHNFKDGYCGISKVENDTYNLCYLSHRNNLKDFKNIRDMEENILFKNPFLKDIFTNSAFLFSEPLVINEISFEQKNIVENHILMVGDSAGMITPLCGNGMAMALHGAKILSQNVKEYFRNHKNRQTLERTYSNQWNKTFNNRLLVGRNIQKMFGNEILSELMIGLFKHSQTLTEFVIRQTHGKPF